MPISQDFLNTLFIQYLEDNGSTLLDSYPVDESQMVPNAGDAVVYQLNGRRWEVITWNDRAEEHVAGTQSISEVYDDAL